MKKILSILIISLTALLHLSAETELLNTATLSFTADVHSIFGFSDTPVSTAIRPAIMTDGISFEGDSLLTQTFYVYYQVFTTDPIAIELSVTNGSNNTVAWHDVYGYLTWSSADGNSMESFNSTSVNKKIVYADVSGSTDLSKPRIGSIPFMLKVDEDSLSNVDWNKEYSWTLQLSIRSNK